MQQKVKVSASDTGAVIVVSASNSEFGFIRVSQERIVFDNSGWAKKKDISCLIPGTVNDLKALGWTANQEISGKIIVKESLKAFNAKDPEKDLKIAGKTGVICNVNGQAIYRKTFFTENLDAIDEILEHTNREEIQTAYQVVLASESKKLENTKENQFHL